jgi:hypothetical protein
MVVANANGTLSTQAIPAGGGGSSSWSINGNNIFNVNTGNVGIGTSDTKGYKLAVAGTAVAEKVVVKLVSAWPDYVFSKDYTLPSLRYVEQYIREHQHLPGVVSAAEVAQNGLDLGETQAQLLKKIEELTLYVIELRKEVDELKQPLGKKTNRK